MKIVNLVCKIKTTNCINNRVLPTSFAKIIVTVKAAIERQNYCFVGTKRAELLIHRRYKDFIQ